MTRPAILAVPVAVAAACGPAPPPSETNSVGMRFVLVPPGVVRMGSPPSEPGRLDNEGPVHDVAISRAFWIGATEVTVGQMDAFVAATGHVTDAERDADGGFGIDFDTARVVRRRGITYRDPGFPGFRPGPGHPAVLVSWQDAEAFCAWLTAKEGRRHRLPTEAECEYAARAGTTTAWSSGASPESLARTANVADASLLRAVPAAPPTEPWDEGFPFVAPVASFPPNAFGLHDAHGNAWECCICPAEHPAQRARVSDGSRGLTRTGAVRRGRRTSVAM